MFFPHIEIYGVSLNVTSVLAQTYFTIVLYLDANASDIYTCLALSTVRSSTDFNETTQNTRLFFCGVIDQFGPWWKATDIFYHFSI